MKVSPPPALSPLSLLSPLARIHQIYQVAAADLRERTRRYGFLAAMGGAVYFGYLIDAGYVSLTIENQRGVLNSAWVGTLTALSLGALLPLFGFYLIKNALERDRTSGVGEILAATPLTGWAYLAGKVASNLAYLVALAAVPAAAALLLQMIAGEDRRLEAGAFLLPLVWLTLPPLALVAALAVLFEAVRWLRGTLGNVLFFGLWNALIVLGAQSPRGSGLDVIGLGLVHDSLYRQLLGRVPPLFGAGGSFTLQIGPRGQAVTRTFVWPGLRWSADLGLHAVVALGAAAVVTIIAALLFDRFDPARDERGTARGAPAAALQPEAEAPAAAAGERTARRRSARQWRPPRFLRWLSNGLADISFAGLVLAELRLMVAGRNRWWLLIAGGLVAAGFWAPMAAIRGGLLAASWLWPLALWSGMGAREARFGTGPLIFSSPRTVAAHVVAMWAAGVMVAAGTAPGIGLRLLMAGDGPGTLAWVAACAFIPSLALALGSWSGGSRLFEVTYLLIWYLGPMNRVPSLDFMGVTAAARAGGSGWIFLSLAAGLLLAAVVGRRRQAQS